MTQSDQTSPAQTGGTGDIHIEEMVGTVALAIMSLLLLLVYLRAEGRNRRLIRRLAHLEAEAAHRD
ncbi:MAG: hypothetical protein GYB65_02430 [Chloroflexi bacterium]|nr:hypothetical protein [Chloroflexota bacterium]